MDLQEVFPAKPERGPGYEPRRMGLALANWEPESAASDRL